MDLTLRVSRQVEKQKGALEANLLDKAEQRHSSFQDRYKCFRRIAGIFPNIGKNILDACMDEVVFDLSFEV